MDKESLHTNTILRAGISVIIPTYNRRELLEKTLASLSEQTLDRSLYEVIIIDDGSTDDSCLSVEHFKQKIPLKYFYQNDEGFRVAKARNIGIYNAEFSTILFFDSGMIASSELLLHHYNLHKKLDDLILIGLSFGVNEYETRFGSEIEKIIDGHSIDEALILMSGMPELRDCRESYLSSVDFKLNEVNLPWVLFWTMHVSVPTAQLRNLGGFDEWFNSWGGEDVELGLRLYQAGCRFELLPGVKSIHYPHAKDPEDKQRDSRRNVQYIHQKHKLESTRLLTFMNWEQLVNLDIQ